MSAAVIAASITIILVAVVTVLNASPNKLVTAARRRAIVETSIGLNLIAIVAILDARMDMLITTRSR